MLTALLDGRARSAGELAMIAGISAQSASMHLAQLLQGGFLKCWQEGRHRYYLLSGAPIAHAIEALGVISTPQAFRPVGASEEICYARTCYDHLAGSFAVRLTAGLEKRRYLQAQGEREFQVSPQGARFFREWGIEVEELRGVRRSFARRCLDWTERKHHLAGILGAKICEKLIEFQWVTREKRSRVVHVSPVGKRELTGLLVE